MEKNIVVPSCTKKPVDPPTTKRRELQRNAQNGVVMRTPSPDERPKPRLSCEAPVRSPTIPPEIRRSNSVNSPENFRSTAETPPPSLVAGLMGLSGDPIMVPSESTADKRRKLLGALEKCDQDLKALKKIIDAVRSAEVAHRRPDPTADDDRKGNVGCDQEQPSPLSVLDGLTRSPSLNCSMKRQPNGVVLLQHNHQQQQVKPKKSGEFIDDGSHSPAISLSERIRLNITEPLPRPSARRSCSSSSPDQYCDDVALCEDSGLKAAIERGMRESVEQVCRDVEWGERREVGRIGLALQDYICRDLIEETVKELGLFCNLMDPRVPPFEACRRRLCF